MATGAARAELEEAGTSIDSKRDGVYELLAFALQPRKHGLGGVDEYLIHKLCSDKPRTIKDAMLRLCKGMNNSIQVCCDVAQRSFHPGGARPSPPPPLAWVLAVRFCWCAVRRRTGAPHPPTPHLRFAAPPSPPPPSQQSCPSSRSPGEDRHLQSHLLCPVSSHAATPESGVVVRGTQ